MSKTGTKKSVRSSKYDSKLQVKENTSFLDVVKATIKDAKKSK